MILNNFVIHRIAAHEVFRRADDRTMLPPRYGQELITLSPEALRALADRVVSVVGKASGLSEFLCVRQFLGLSLSETLG